jgi:hypothetical protein
VLTRDVALATDAGSKDQNISKAFDDPEGFYYWGISLVAAGNKPFGLELVTRAVGGGFACSRAMITEPWLDSVRGEPEFIRLLRDAEDRHRKTAAAFQSAGGPQLLSTSP